MQNDIDLETKIHSLINRYKRIVTEKIRNLKAELFKVENINSELNTKINYAIQQLELFQKKFLDQYMTNTKENHSIEILGKTYEVTCDAKKIDLFKAAKFLILECNKFKKVVL